MKHSTTLQTHDTTGLCFPTGDSTRTQITPYGGITPTTTARRKKTTETEQQHASIRWVCIRVGFRLRSLLSRQVSTNNNLHRFALSRPFVNLFMICLFIWWRWRSTAQGFITTPQLDGITAPETPATTLSKITLMCSSIKWINLKGTILILLLQL